MDFVCKSEVTVGATTPAAADAVRVFVGEDQQDTTTPVYESWTPGSTMHNDWSWSQQLELLRSRRAEQDWSCGSPEPKTTATPEMIAQLVTDMHTLRLNHRDRMRRLRSDLDSGDVPFGIQHLNSRMVEPPAQGNATSGGASSAAHVAMSVDTTMTGVPA